MLSCYVSYYSFAIRHAQPAIVYDGFRVAQYEPHTAERVPLSTGDIRKRVLGTLVRGFPQGGVSECVITLIVCCRDFLESLDEGTFFSSAVPSLMSASPYANPVTLGVDSNTYMTDTQPPQQTQPPATNGAESAAPSSEQQSTSEEPAPVVLPAATKTERFFLTAADQGSGTRNERLNMVIRSKYEAGLLKPYNYVKGYARLSRWMDKKYVAPLVTRYT